MTAVNAFRDKIASLLAEMFDTSELPFEEADAILALPEMRAIKSVLKSYARPSLTRRDLENKGLPDSVIDWVVDG